MPATEPVAAKPLRLVCGVRGQPVFVAENRAWLLKDDAGMYALSAVCSHLGCTVRWEAGAFRCPCHSSRYAWTWSGAARSSNPAAAHGVGGHRRCRPPGGGPGQAGGGCIPAGCVGVKSLAGWLFWFSGPPWFKGARQCSEPGGLVGLTPPPVCGTMTGRWRPRGAGSPVIRRIPWMPGNCV